MLVVGIDLGTTNSCLAWAEGDSEVMVFGVPQLVPTGRERRALLPSMLYAPVVGEDAHEPWCEPPWITGELARARGLEVPGRAVTSAKSWLYHPTSDPTEPSLPAAKTAGTPTLSAVDASARVLRHLVRAFEESTGHSLRSACVVLTVPASFDESARAYTLEAARRARLSPKLLEEPQAAFYDYMGAGDGRSLRDLTARGGGRARVLVVDVGGGTTDLSFISVEDRKGAIHVERIATGDHLLLGGDNMDLALAAEVRARLGVTFDPAREGQLVLACRAAKEALLSDRPPERFPIAVAGKGSRIVGRVTRAEITREDAERVVVEGFFPKVARGAVPRVSRAGLVSTGLPFARDPAITRHVAQFLEKYAGGELPDAVLLNGGVFAPSGSGPRSPTSSAPGRTRPCASCKNLTRTSRSRAAPSPTGACARRARRGSWRAPRAATTSGPRTAGEPAGSASSPAGPRRERSARSAASPSSSARAPPGASISTGRRPAPSTPSARSST